MSRLLCDQMALSCVTFWRLCSTGSSNEAEGNQMTRRAAGLRITSLSDGALVQWDKQQFLVSPVCQVSGVYVETCPKCWLRFDVLKWVYLNCCTLLYFFLPDIYFIVDNYFYKFILKGFFSFVLIWEYQSWTMICLKPQVGLRILWCFCEFHLFHCGKVALQDV